MNDASMRVTALEMAARLGLPHDMTLKGARAYLAFLQGKEETWNVSTLAPSLWAAHTVTKKAVAAKAKKAAPKKQAIVMRRTKP